MVNYTFQCSRCRLYNSPGSKFCGKCGGQVVDLWKVKTDVGFKSALIMFSILLLMIIVGGILAVISVILNK